MAQKAQSPASSAATQQPAAPNLTNEQEKVVADVYMAAKGQKTWGEVLGINAGQAYNMAQLGYKMLQEGRIEEAGAMFRGLATLNPKDPYMHLALGPCHHRADKIADAIPEYSTAIELNPKLANAYANRGELYISKKQQEKAFGDLKKAVELDPKGQDPSTIRARAILATAAAKIKEKQAAPAKKK